MLRSALGQTLFIRRGVVHAFRSDGPEPAICLCILTAGVLGPGYFRELAKMAAAGAPDPAKVKEIMLRHGLVPAAGPWPCRRRPRDRRCSWHDAAEPGGDDRVLSRGRARPASCGAMPIRGREGRTCYWTKWVSPSFPQLRLIL